MTDVFGLLTLPNTSTAFTAIKSDTFDGSASPRRKAARLDTDSDVSSASRSNRTQQRGPVKLVIIGDKLPRFRQGDEQSKLLLLQRSIKLILTPFEESGLNDPRSLLPNTTSYEDVFVACQSAVTIANTGEALYDKLRLELEQSIGRVATSLASEKLNENENNEDGPVLWLKKFAQVCEWFDSRISLLASLLTYLDQVYVARNTNLLSIRTLAFSFFAERIFENPQIQLRLRSGVSEWVNTERKLRLAHSHRLDIIPQLIHHLIVHNQYHAFEEYYVKLTKQFYTAESAELSRSMSNARDFFNHILARIGEEEQRSQDLLPVGSWNIVRQAVEQCIWGDRMEWLANNTVGLYAENNDCEKLRTMYSLLKRVEGVKFLVNAFRVYAQDRVQSIVKDVSEDEKMVDRLLTFKRRANEIITTFFLDEKASLSSSSIIMQPNNEFIYALGDAFSIGFKIRGNKPAEMIARYLDRIMRKGQVTSTDAEFEALLDAVLGLYRYTKDKDVFRTFYHRALAKRLLLQKSASDDFEAAMLKKLKEQYDPEFGMGEEMFKDLALSREFVREYHSKLSDDSPGRKLSVMVLQRSAWPFTIQKDSIDLPPNMQAELTAYVSHYKGKHSNHKLHWDQALGTATLFGRFKPGNKELSVSLYQALVLLLFNSADEWRYHDILEQTRIEPAELKRVLQSLACAKKRVLKKLPPGRDVDETDSFRFNVDFEDTRAKVHINSIQAKILPEESIRTNESIEGDRVYYLEAAIVRVMKARKELTYEQLKAATIEAVKNHFVPTVDSIKKRIDVLVEREFLERSDEDKNKFKYIA